MVNVAYSELVYSLGMKGGVSMGLLRVYGAAEATGLTVTADMFKGLTDSVTANAGVLIPIGVGIMSIMVGIRVIPKILSKFF